MSKKVLKSSIETKVVSVDTLIEYDRNNKNHPEKQVNLLANIIDRFWYIDQIVVDKNNIIIAGHWRLEAIKKMWYDQVEVKVMDIDSKDTQILRLLHNKVSEFAENNLENIVFELKDIWLETIWDFNLSELYPEFDVPDFNMDEYNPDWSHWDNKKSYIIQVICNDEMDQDNLYVKLQDDWYNVKKL